MDLYSHLYYLNLFARVSAFHHLSINRFAWGVTMCFIAERIRQVLTGRGCIFAPEKRTKSKILHLSDRTCAPGSYFCAPDLFFFAHPRSRQGAPCFPGGLDSNTTFRRKIIQEKKFLLGLTEWSLERSEKHGQIFQIGCLYLTGNTVFGPTLA